MSTNNKTFWDINRHTQHLQKVNFRQYLSSKNEPADKITGVSTTKLEDQPRIIEETYLRKKIFRNLATSLRMR